jgi:hypothetical protein
MACPGLFIGRGKKAPIAATRVMDDKIAAAAADSDSIQPDAGLCKDIV